jgi:ectoine hydroxylase-related dioxygenase (phytanoyl-CoA dioxygenase family)
MPIAGRAGDLVIWHDAIPHGSRPNRASLPRIVQYIRMYPAWQQHAAVWK